ncbi:hypothetical protein DAC17_79 [Bacteroides phage DAC17]|nr:hypothetical protein DAC17_79 [Bacteroides phage DAC17]
MSEGLEEVWMDIPGYEGLYQVSNLGRFKALSKTRVGARCSRVYKERILSQKVNFDKYYYISLSKGDKKTSYRAHRLIALAFLGESGLPVDHIDGNPLNNNVTNLRYVSQSENILNPNTICKQYKPVVQMSLDGSSIAEYCSVSEAAKAVSTTGDGTHIGQCCSGKRVTAYGYKWKWK